MFKRYNYGKMLFNLWTWYTNKFYQIPFKYRHKEATIFKFTDKNDIWQEDKDLY